MPSSGTPSCVGEPLAAAGAEHLRGHVLDHAEELHPGLLRHLRGPRRDLLREELRRRHDDRLRARQELAERDRDVAGPRRHVDDEHVELAPVHVGEELLERAVQHRAAPHHRLVVVEEEPDRHQLQVVRTGGTIILSTSTGFCGSRAGAGSSGRRRRRRARRPRGQRRTRRRGSRSASTCRRRPCPMRPRSPARRGRARFRSSLGRAAAQLRRQRRALVGLITSNSSRTDSTPSTAPTASATCSWKEERSGQPTTVSAIVTATSPPSSRRRAPCRGRPRAGAAPGRSPRRALRAPHHIESPCDSAFTATAMIGP